MCNVSETKHRQHRWSIYIDVEGFSHIYEEDQTRALSALSGLMDAIHRIASKVYTNSPDRLFIHQFGDGFVIVSDFHESSSERPLAVAISVMQHLIAVGIATKAAISAGDFSDVLGCYPSGVQKAALDGRRTFSVGEGLMSIIPVMGMALISPYKIAQKKSGAVLLLDAVQFSEIPDGVRTTFADPITIDWVHTNFPLVEEISKKAGLHRFDTQTTEEYLMKYIQRDPKPSESWIKSTLEGAHISV